MDYEENKYAKAAEENFLKGYNCTQAVFLAFQDLFEMDEKTAAKLSSSFGGGMGRLREVCGAVSGMFLVAGMLYGYDSPEARQEKNDHYKRIQELAKTYVRRELLGLSEKRQQPVSEKRTEEYYKKRPCPKLVAMAAAIMGEYIKEHPISSLQGE